jgi:hypothetical protein
LFGLQGTNDSKMKEKNGPANWENDGKTGELEYVMSYSWMIAQFQAMKSNPNIYVTIPVPNYKDGSSSVA